MHKSAKRPLSDDATALLRTAFREDLNLLRFPVAGVPDAIARGPRPNSSDAELTVRGWPQTSPLPTKGSAKGHLQAKRGVRAAGGKSRKGALP